MQMYISSHVSTALCKTQKCLMTVFTVLFPWLLKTLVSQSTSCCNISFILLGCSGLYVENLFVCTGFTVVNFQIIKFYSISYHISLFFILWICTGLQNPFGYGNLLKRSSSKVSIKMYNNFVTRSSTIFEFYITQIKSHLIQLTNTSTYTSDIHIVYEDKPIPIAMETKFLGLFINNTFSWKTHNEYIKSKLSSTCYAMRSIKPNLSLNTLKTIYFSSFHSVMSYDLLFWGHSSDSRKIFKLQKKIIRIMMHRRSSNSGRNLFF